MNGPAPQPRLVIGEVVQLNLTETGPEVEIYTANGGIATVLFPITEDPDLAKRASVLEVDDRVTIAWHPAVGEEVDAFGVELTLSDD